MRVVDCDVDVISLIHQAAAGLLDEHHALERVRTPSPSLWPDLASQGLPLLMTPEGDGGAAVGARGAVMIARLFGSRLAPEPIVDNAIVPGGLGALLGAAPLAARIVDMLAHRSETMALAWQEADRQIDPWPISSSLASGRLKARKIACSKANSYLVTANTDGGAGVVWVRRGQPGVNVLDEPDVGGGSLSTVEIEGTVEASDLFVGPEVAAAVEKAVSLGTLCTAAQTLGVCMTAADMTLDYLRTRQQFGKPIGAFQALQHRAVDMATELALCQAAVDRAAEAFDANSAADETRASISAAKARSASVAALVAREVVQMHGAIGFTEESDVGLFVRACIGLAERYGSARLHRRRFLELESAVNG